MPRIDAAIALALFACLTACSAEDKREPRQAAATRQATAAIPVAAIAGIAAPADVNAASVAAPTAGEARQVVVDYYTAINARDYRTAYASWSGEGAASGQSFEHFSGGYANTESVDAVVGKAGNEEGAAGSRYITVPVELRAHQFNGTVRSYQGRFALRAVVADGATGEQRRWHLDSAEMQRLP